MFFHDFPYTNFHEMNLDWIIAKINEFQKELDDIQVQWLQEAKAYTDEQVAGFQNQLNALSSEITSFKNEVNATIDTFEDDVQTQINNMLFSLEQFETRVEDEIKSSYDYVNQAIDNNNDYIINEMSNVLRTMTVINYFTGQAITIQDMFDYLAQFHLENAISYTQLASRSKTVNQIIALNMTYTELALNGGSLITP